MSAIEAVVVPVREGWREWRSAEVPLGDLEGVHWHQPPGALRPIVHAFVPCSRVRGLFPHRCAEKGTRRLRVCVLKHSVGPSLYAELTRRADRRSAGKRTEPPGGGREIVAGSVRWLLLLSGAALAIGAVVAHRSRDAPVVMGDGEGGAVLHGRGVAA
jgi:hypothetical protein